MPKFSRDELESAGDGQWQREEDFWAVPRATAAAQEYAEACKEFDPKHREKQTRPQLGQRPELDEGSALLLQGAAVVKK